MKTIGYCGNLLWQSSLTLVARGGGSCGPKPMDKYIFPIRKETWTLKMEPFAAR